MGVRYLTIVVRIICPFLGGFSVAVGRISWLPLALGLIGQNAERPNIYENAVRVNSVY